MIDFFEIHTDNTDIIRNSYLIANDNGTLIPSKKGHESISFELGIDIIISFIRSTEANKFRRMYVSFSVHKQANNGLHNADFLSFSRAKITIKKILAYLEITEFHFHYFNVDKIELGFNYDINDEPKYLLDAMLMVGSKFFSYQNQEKNPYFKNTKSEKGTNNIIFKHYSKGRQIDKIKRLPNYELGYCQENLMRWEISIERLAKVPRLKIRELSDLFRDGAEKLIKEFMALEFARVFVFDHQSVATKQITKNSKNEQYLKKFKTKNYWYKTKTLDRDKKKYDNLPKRKNIKNLIEIQLKKELEKTAISTAFLKQKSDKTENVKTTTNKGVRRDSDSENCIVCQSLYLANNTKSKKCKVTGVDISCQKENSQFLNLVGLRFLKKYDSSNYKKLEKQFLNLSKEYVNNEEKLYYLAHNIRNKHFNTIHNRRSYEQRNYHPNQLQFSFP
ncbi:hypothetical protein SAMN05660477_01969 [Soonwooa buanensis]|uniref:Uncharacterized protein n=1 Tax=Soonwooa buanensis TaxID=619805 RepID=A0A1T5FDW2_9FLAO|nr:hypothetical protein [Soonwooa buanensis]SKB94322.1 hypothetical protein SAMN05660477_01969 [Soonwooa buanensis]